MLQEACSCDFRKSYLQCYKDVKSPDPEVQKDLKFFYEMEANRNSQTECDKPCMEGVESEWQYYICQNYCFHKITNGGVFTGKDKYLDIACNSTAALQECHKQMCPNRPTPSANDLESLMSCHSQSDLPAIKPAAGRAMGRGGNKEERLTCTILGCNIA